MYLAVVQILIIVILIFLTLIVIGMLFWLTPSQSLDVQSQSNNLNSDIKIIRDVVTNDSYLHRLLMIETISNSKTYSSEGEGDLIDKMSKCGLNGKAWASVDEKNIHIVVDAECKIREGKPVVTEKDSLGSEDVTFKKMSNGIQLLGRSLVRSFGGAISQRIASLMQQRNTIIRDYYRSMRDVVCHNGTCVHVIDVPPPNSDTKGSRIIRPLTSTEPFFPSIAHEETSDENGIKDFDPNSSVDQGISISSLDITTITLRKLETVTREIADNIAAAFHIRDVDYSNNDFETKNSASQQTQIGLEFGIPNRRSTKRPIIHYERLFNLIIMYDKELLNQAKAYAAKQYDISMNCAQSSLEITHHITDELKILMRDNFGFDTLSNRDTIRSR